MIEFILYVLIAFRVSELFVFDDGPFEVFLSLRGWANRAKMDNSPRRNLANALSCIHCTGLWVSLALGIVHYILASETAINAVLFALAVAGGQSILANTLGRKAE